MDTQRVYNNANLEKKRRKKLQEEAAASSLAKARQQFQPKHNRIDLAYDKSVNPEETKQSWRQTKDKLVELFDSLSGNDKTHLLRLLKVVEKETDFFEDERYCLKFIEGCRELARWGDYWVRQPEDWVNKTHNVERQFLGIVNHLFAKYKVPAFMHKCFYVTVQINRKHQEWFMHLGSGQNIRNAKGIPFPLTKMMAHHFTQAPENLSVQEAFTFARIRSIGGSKGLIEAWLGSRMANNTHSNPEFWDSVLRFFIDNPMLDLNQVGPIIDYLYNQKFVDNMELTQDGQRINHGPPQPFLSMKGRNPEVLLDQVEKWHTQTAKLKKRGAFVQWKPCGIDGARFEEGAGPGKKAFIITELLNSSELKEEGREMSHCVGSYSDSCSSGRCAVFSLRQVEGDGIGRKATISVNLNPNKVLNEARGKRNDVLSQNISRLVRSWANARFITISSWARI